jgi:hypothetical protein
MSSSIHQESAGCDSIREQRRGEHLERVGFLELEAALVDLGAAFEGEQPIVVFVAWTCPARRELAAASDGRQQHHADQRWSGCSHLGQDKR